MPSCERWLTRDPAISYGRVVRPLPMLLAMLLTGGCGTVELGDNFVPPDVQLDEDYFFCVLQPTVIAAQSCASGITGEMGQCHSARSAMRLSIAGETDAPPTCVDGVATTPIPASYQANFDAVRFAVQADPLASPLYRRPLQLDLHPRRIFDEASDEAAAIATFIGGGP